MRSQETQPLGPKSIMSLSQTAATPGDVSCHSPAFTALCSHTRASDHTPSFLRPTCRLSDLPEPLSLTLGPPAKPIGPPGLLRLSSNWKQSGWRWCSGWWHTKHSGKSKWCHSCSCHAQWPSGCRGSRCRLAQNLECLLTSAEQDLASGGTQGWTRVGVTCTTAL